MLDLWLQLSNVFLCEQNLILSHFLFIVSVKSWSDARAACQSEGGDLTSVNNIYESGFVYTLGSTKAPFWIGLSDSKVSTAMFNNEIV